MSESRQQARSWKERADAETAERLRVADTDVAAARVALEEAMAQRARVIAETMEDEGWTLARVADVLGISKQRVWQLRKAE